MNLNSAQQRVVEAGDGPVAIIAGPGAGKTKTLTARIFYLLTKKQVLPTNVLALTFTKKAAEELAGRVGQKEVTVCTFHALCHSLLGSDMQVISEPERVAIIKKLSKPGGYTHTSTRELGLLISRVKNGAERDVALVRLTKEYDAELAKINRADFDDLLVRTRDALANQTIPRPGFTHILVDEFQDTNALQYELLHLLRRTDNLCVIGDPNQSIYGFRGASGNIFDTFKADFPTCITITLDTNYRSAPEIVRMTNAIFGNHQHSARQAKGEARAVEVLNEYSEARWVLNEIQKAIGGADLLKATSTDQRRSLKDFAILYRSRSVANVVQKMVADSGLPYQVVGEGSPYEQAAVQQVIALLRCMAGGEAEVKGFSATQVRVLLQKVPHGAPPADTARHLTTVFALAASPALDQFIGTLVRFKTLPDALAYIDSIAAQQFYDSQAEALTLLTIHAAKGLEFPHVFLLAAEEGQLPHNKAHQAEEKRLFYVAATRAQDQLDILHARKRGGKSAKPSYFVVGIPDSLLTKVSDPSLQADQRRSQKHAAKRAQTSLF